MAKRKRASGKTLVTDARDIVDRCAGLQVRLAARRITRFMDARLAPTGLSLAKVGLMAHVAAAGDDTIGALAEYTGLDQSTLSRNLRGLEKEGLVEIAIVEKDLRRRAVWLTETGARQLEAALPLWRNAHAALSDRLKPKHVKALAGIANALAPEDT